MVGGVQDTVVIVLPYPYCIEEDHMNVPLDYCWYVCPQLYLTCYLRPRDDRPPKNRTYKTGPDDLCHHLVSFQHI